MKVVIIDKTPLGRIGQVWESNSDCFIVGIDKIVVSNGLAQSMIREKILAEIQEDEILCPKCEQVVKKRNFNHYFGICHDCEDNCGH